MEYPVASRQSHTGTAYSQLQPNNGSQSSYSSGPGLSSGGSSGIGPPHSDFMAYRQQSDYPINSPQTQPSSYSAMQVGSGPLSSLHPEYDYHNRGPPAQHQRTGLYSQSSVGKFSSLRQPSVDINASSETISQMQHLPSHSYYDQSTQNWAPSQQPPNYMSPHGHNNSECLGPSSHHLHKMYYENQIGPGYGGPQGSHYNVPGGDVPPPTLGKSDVLPQNSSGTRYSQPYPTAQFQQPTTANYAPGSQGNEQSSIEQVAQPHWGPTQNHYMQAGGREVRHQTVAEPMSPSIAASSAGDVSYVGRPGSVDSSGAISSNFQMVASGSVAGGSTDDERPLSRISEPSTPRSGGSIAVAPIYVSASAAISSQHSTSPAIGSPQANSPMSQQMFMSHSQSHPQYSHSPQASTSHVVQASSRNVAYASAGGGKPVYSGGGAFTAATQSHGMAMPQQNYPVRNASQSMYTVHQRPPHSYAGGSAVPYGYQQGVASTGTPQSIPYGTPPPGLHQSYSYGPPPNSAQIQVPGGIHGGRMMGPPPPMDQYRGSPNPPLRRPLPPGSSGPLYSVMNSIPFEPAQSATLSMNGRSPAVKNNDSIPCVGNFRSSGGSDDAQSLTPVNQMSPSHSSLHDDDSLMSNPMTPVANNVCPTSGGNNSATSSAQHKLFVMGDEPERCAWVERYLLFMDEIGRPLSNLPQVAKHPLDLYRLYIIVREYGGLMQVIKSKRWKEISKYVNISASASGTCTLRKNYIKYLLDFECRFDREGMDPRPIITQIESMSSKKKKSDSGGSGTMSSGSGVLPNAISSAGTSLPQEGSVSPLNNFSEPLLSQSGLMPSSINGAAVPSSVQSQRQFMSHPGYPQGFSMPSANQVAGPVPSVQNMGSHNGAAISTVFPGAPPPSWSSPVQHYNYPPGCQAPLRLPQPSTLPPVPLLQGPTPPLSMENVHGHPSNVSSLHGHQPNPIPTHYMNQSPQFIDNNHFNFTSSNGFQPGVHLNFSNAFPHKDGGHIPANHQIRQLQQLVHNQVPLPSSISSSMAATHTTGMSAPHLSLTTAAAATAGHLQQHQHLSETSAATAQHRSSALLGMLISDQRHGSTSLYSQWPGYSSSGPLGTSSSLRSEISHSLPPAQFGQHSRNAAHGVIISPSSSHLQGLHSMEAQLRQRFGVDQLPSSRHQSSFFLHQTHHQDAELMLQYHKRMSEHQAAHAFDPNKLEGTEIHCNVGRRRLTPKDLGAVNPWRMYMGLKSGLACEGTRALNTLNIILADAEALSYMSLMRLPGLLETLVELWRRSLIELFPKAAFHELEMNSLEEPDVEVKEEISKLTEDECFQWNSDELLERMQRLRLKIGNFTFRTRCGRRVKLDMIKVGRVSRENYLGPKKICAAACDDGANHAALEARPWQTGCGDTTRHIISVKQLPKRRRCLSSATSAAATSNELNAQEVAAKRRMRTTDSDSHVDVKQEIEAAPSDEDKSDLSSSSSRLIHTNGTEVNWRAAELNQRVFNIWPDEAVGQLVARCCAISTALRNLSFLNTNEAELCAHPGLLRLLACLLLYLEGESPSLPAGGVALRDDALVLLTNIAGQLNLITLPDVVVTPLLDALLNALCRHAAWDACHRLALECFARLSVQECNVDLLLALRPWTRLERLFDVLCQHLASTAPEDQVFRELALSALSYLVRGGAGSAALCVARANPKPVPLLIDLVETAETAAIHIAQTQGVAVLRERPELMGTSLHMLRRAAATLNMLAQLPENAALLKGYQARLLLLVMSQILDQQVAAMLADALFLVSKDSTPQPQSVEVCHLQRLDVITTADALVKVESNDECDPVIQIKSSPL